MNTLSAIGAAALTTLSLTTALGLPSAPHNQTFALLWLLFMVLAGLPLAFVDAVLVRRTKVLPLQALAPITRDSDLATFWRLLAPLAMLALMLLIAFSAYYATQGLVISSENIATKEIFPFLIVFLAMGFAWVGMARLLPYVAILVPAVLVLNVVLVPQTLQIHLLTPEQWQEIGRAVLLANGLGLGLYAWLVQQRLHDERASTTVLPVWLTQTLVGALTIAVGSAEGNLSVVCHVLTAVFACAILAEVIVRQLRERFMAKPIALGGVMLLIVAATYAATYVAFDYVMIVTVLVAVLGYAILTGWLMKISHARKALNMQSEALYNLWRMGIRIAVPLTVIWLLVGLAL
ncbi:hypothetical protein [Agitococcus lubricus]|uniref:Uncharacterized protein n=1 Tax=Agitococcus lubricus TaxID=1077255 RepID=A0A2T5J3R1_9GAMM|nr:hypothetical protein [Agitococcus lubricus]PTQ91143.1 hypothetical protein C8N29_101215 [Agitococcus lubricus]